MTEKELDALLLRLGVKEVAPEKSAKGDKKKKGGKEKTSPAPQNNNKKENKDLHLEEKKRENPSKKADKKVFLITEVHKNEQSLQFFCGPFHASFRSSRKSSIGAGLLR